MRIVVPILGAIIVAVIGLVGQFFISNRRFIPDLREERAKAYSRFLSACLTGMHGVLLEKEILEELEKVVGTYSKNDEGKMRDHVSEMLKNYNNEINQTLSYMQIVCPAPFAALGKILMTEISDFRENPSRRVEMELAYSSFTERAHNDIKSLSKQSTSWRAIFSRSVSELED